MATSAADESATPSSSGPADAAREQARAMLSLVQGFAGADPGPGGDCAWCPVCRAARALRDGRPDVAEHLTDALQAGLAAVQALNAALDAAAQRPPSASAPD